MVDTIQIRKEFVRRLRQALSDKGVTKDVGVTIHEELKRRGAKATTQAINKWLNHDSMPARANMQILADWLDVRRAWLQYGEDPKRVGGKTTEGNVSDASIRGRIPLIGWAKAGEFCEAVDLFEPGDAEDWYPCHASHSDSAFALRVEGDSMTSPYPGQRSYPEGTILFIDPERPVVNGCRVIAKIDDDVTFKCYVEDMGRKYLRPINPVWKERDITDLPVTICGVVIGSYMPE